MCAEQTRAVALSDQAGVAAPLVRGVLDEGAVGIEPVEQVPRDPGQHGRVEPGRFGDEPSLDGGTVLGFERRRNLFERAGDHADVFGRDEALRLGSRDGGYQYRQRFTAEATAGTEVIRSARPSSVDGD